MPAALPCYGCLGGGISESCSSCGSGRNTFSFAATDSPEPYRHADPPEDYRPDEDDEDEEPAPAPRKRAGFVSVPAETFFAFLSGKGFVRCPDGRRSRREVVYERTNHNDGRYKVLVYTSIATGRARARACGKDAIRVVAIFEDGKGYSRGAAKTKRVFRTGTVEGVLERTYQRMREAYAACNRQANGAETGKVNYRV
jgi:hypothetical protein